MYYPYKNIINNNSNREHLKAMKRSKPKNYKNKISKNLDSNFTRVLIVTFCGSFIFGFIDNILLVLFGEAIDRTIADTFGFSTMFSAGLGNTLSDAVGTLGEVFIAGLIISVFGQARASGISRGYIMAASTLGIITGCLLGLLPLIWL